MKVTTNNLSSFLHSNKGFSLIEIMIGIGIMTIVITANLMMFSNLDRQTQVLAEKVAVSDLKRQMVAILGNGTICSTELASNIFNPTGPYVINADSLATQEINLDRIHSGTTATASALIEKDQLASSMSQRLLVDKIKFRNFTATDRPENFFADLEVSFKGGAMSLAPVVMKMYIETDPGDPSNARKITGCAESGKTGRAHRIVFTTSQAWTVPAGVKSAFVTMAGGGGSGLGWRVLNAIHSGHSGGYVFSHPVDLVPGEVMTVTVGLGGKGHQTINTMVAATPGPPYFIYSNPPEDGLGGYPGSSSRLISPSLGTLLECAGGSGANIGGIDSFTGTKVAGDLPGAIVGSGAPAFPSPNRAAVGAFATASSPGACGLNNYGIGNPGTRQWGATPAGPPSGSYAGGITPFGYGSGGSINRSGCYVTSTLIGTCTDTFDGRDGVVMLDLWY